MTAQAWTADRVQTLKKLYEAGLSSAQIAKELGGATRSSVIGKLWRIGLRRPGCVIVERKKRVEKPRPNRVRYSIAPAFPRLPKVAARPAPVEIPPSLSLSLADLGAFQCRFITSAEGEAARYCGHGASGSWCGGHSAFVYAPREARVQQRKAA